jgi:protein phosphatase
MSRFAIDPKWLIYLPPTMSPCETSSEQELLEHPREALAYFRRNAQHRAICEQKHMGSRAIAIVCRNEGVPRKRFGVADEGIGTVYTRTGRRFFDDREMETSLLLRVQSALAVTGFFDTFQTDWVCLDCELMPWSAKAQALLQEQYAAVGAAAQAALPEAIEALRRTTAGGRDASDLLSRHERRLDLARRYTSAYQQYCWPVRSVEDLKLAPFHVLATEGKVHVDQSQAWHMETLTNVCSAERVLLATPHRVVDLHDEASEREATEWWHNLTGNGGEGMVVKPLDFVVRSRKGLVQPAIKCRGTEYLRIIYGPEYTLPEHLGRLRDRSVGRKRSLALREFALGIEALERFVRQEPLRRVHECVFGVLALESEPIDPRL